MDFIQTPIKKANKKVEKAVTKKAPTQPTAKQIYKEAKANHKAEIKKLRDNIKTLKADIKKHKLLAKQAKTTYKLTKLSSK